MRVTLTKRLGQTPEGSTVDMTEAEAWWLIHRRYAVHAVQSTEDSATPAPDDDHGEQGSTTPTTTPRRKR